MRPGRAAPLVLVADDEHRVRLFCSEVLTFAGYVVVEAADGDEAVVKYLEHRPDVVLLDLNMPTLNGMAVLRGLRGLDPDARVIVVSAQRQRETVLEALQAGALDFVLKPFDIERLLGGLNRVTGWRSPDPSTWATEVEDAPESDDAAST
jgi:two-component system chemotaxis response regulator CheY